MNFEHRFIARLGRWQGLRAAVAGLLLAAYAGLAGAGVIVCADAGESLSLRVSFNAAFENAITVSSIDSRRRIIGFNNFFGRGAGGEWQRGAGDWQTPRLSAHRCFRIDGQHKAGPARPALPWIASACRVSGRSIGFEDGEDMDYNDARVEVLEGVIERVEPPCTAAPPRDMLKKKAMKRPEAAAEAEPPPVAAAPPERQRLETMKRDEVERKAMPKAARPPAAANGAGGGQIFGSAPRTLAFKLPDFPFPPPDPSARLRIPRGLVVRGEAAPNFGSVATRMEEALARNGYSELSYFAVPGGFTLVTQLERINPDATPAAEQRWNIAVEPVSLKSFSLEAYLRALLQKDAGFFRVIAFIFSSEPFTASGKKVPAEEAMKWIDKGANTLPRDVAERPYGDDMVATALVYEFEIRTHGANAQQRKPSPHDGAQHLRASGILRALGE